MKSQGASEIDVKRAVNELKNRKKLLEDKELEFLPKDAGFERARMEDLLKRRFFIAPSFEVYGGNAGQFDFGPMGCAMKYNLLSVWRNHFILEDSLLEVDCTIITPEPVLKASGHVERFADLMVKDVKNGECFRLDHLIKTFFEDLIINTKNLDSKLKQEYEETIVKLDGYSKDEMKKVLDKFQIKSPITKNDLTDPIEFNLMFSTHIGPTGHVKGYLRPETAQGIFVNFKRLLEFNHGRLPFGCAQIGQAFRNEISPRAGLIRVREFTLAEIEYFVDPNKKDFEKFETLKDLELNLYSACSQMDGKSAAKVRLGEAVANKIINNETLGYFMGRIHLFLTKAGVDASRLRFRQHMSNEMAHYASDCWDAECLTSFGWVECVGCADRSCYDLSQHSKASNVKLVAERVLTSPKTIFVKQCILQKTVIGKKFKAEAKAIVEQLNSLQDEQIDALETQLNSGKMATIQVNGKPVEISTDMVTIKKGDKVVYVEEITPTVIEPSFGIGRIMYAIWEHNFRIRETDQQRTYFSLPAEIAPIKCSILPLSANAQFNPFVKQIKEDLTRFDISHKVDDSSGSIGKRYSRADEIAIPFGITIDFETINAPHSAT